MSGPNNEIYISFTSLVNPHTTQILMGALTNAVNNGHTKIHLMLSSPGGQVAEGITLYNLIRSLPSHLQNSAFERDFAAVEGRF